MQPSLHYLIQRSPTLLFSYSLVQILYHPTSRQPLSAERELGEKNVLKWNGFEYENNLWKDTNTIPLSLPVKLKGKALIWYNTLWDTMAGGHDDDMSLENPDKGYGYLIDKLGARIIQTDRPQYLIEYLRSRKLHD